MNHLEYAVYGNVQTGIGLALTGSGMGWTSFWKLASSASVLNGVDDMSANFTKDGKTLLEQGLGNKNGRIAKGVLSGWGTAGSINSLLEHGFKITTVTDVVGGALDAKTTADNAIKSTSNGN